MLNEAKIRAAKARSKPWKLTDSHRLFLLVTPNGSKLWKWSYQFDGKQKTMAFGDYPWVSLRDARETRRGRMDLDDGHDPSALRKVQVDANIEAARITFELMALEWHARSAPTWTAVLPRTSCAASCATSYLRSARSQSRC